MNLEQKIEKIMNYYVGQNLTLGFAESCTGGLLSSMIVAGAGASQFFLGSIVSYDRRVKRDILKVPMPLMQCLGEVSTPVALAMARGARVALGVDWSIAITGVAGPTGGTEEKPVGTVCFALIGPGFEHAELKLFKSLTDNNPLERVQIQKLSAQYAIDLILAKVVETQ